MEINDTSRNTLFIGLAFSDYNKATYIKNRSPYFSMGLRDYQAVDNEA
jgi:hypothetical protein